MQHQFLQINIAIITVKMAAALLKDNFFFFITTCFQNFKMYLLYQVSIFQHQCKHLFLEKYIMCMWFQLIWIVQSKWLLHYNPKYICMYLILTMHFC